MKEGRRQEETAFYRKVLSQASLLYLLANCCINLAQRSQDLYTAIAISS
jgi:hypothetical protein